MNREEEKRDAMDVIHKEVDRLGEFANRVRECHGDAVEALARFDHAKSGTEELITMFIAAGSINAVREECKKFTEYFERHAEGEAPRVKSEFYRLAENDVKMLDALAARIESRRAEAHKALAGMTACEDPIKEEKYGLIAADALGSAASTCRDFYAAVTMMAELATARDSLPKGAKLTRTILQRSIAHAVKNAQDAVIALSASATSDHTKSVIDGFRKAFLDVEEEEK